MEILIIPLVFEDRFIGFKQSLLKNNIVSYSKVDEYIQKYSFLQGIEEYVLTNQIDKIIEIFEILGNYQRS